MKFYFLSWYCGVGHQLSGVNLVNPVIIKKSEVVTSTHIMEGQGQGYSYHGQDQEEARLIHL